MCTPFCITYCCRLVSQYAKTSGLQAHVEQLPIVSTDNNKMPNSKFYMLPMVTVFCAMALFFLGMCCRCFGCTGGSMMAIDLLIHYCIPSCQHSSFLGHARIYNAHERVDVTCHCIQCLPWELCMCIYTYVCICPPSQTITAYKEEGC